ncbi:uncharacterized protein BDW70DRAFT_142954, partial [Aspergillus foveolatus]|uniref:uncharacterized protein n=1 Tax=Aspergillus foveolatus TaxID=210207 RepID=UPI003CCD6103
MSMSRSIGTYLCIFNIPQQRIPTSIIPNVPYLSSLCSMNDLTRGSKACVEKGYNKLLIHDHVITEVGMHPYTTAYDMNMLVSLAAPEKTEKQWM